MSLLNACNFKPLFRKKICFLKLKSSAKLISDSIKLKISNFLRDIGSFTHSSGFNNQQTILKLMLLTKTT